MKLRLRTFAGAPALGLAIAMLTLLAPATAFAGAAPVGSQIRFGNGEFDGLMPGRNCIFGSSAANANVKLTWRDSDGTVKEKTSVPSGSFGYWRYCAAVTILALGDSLKANDGSTLRQFTMPLITLKVDRVANEFRGRAPANSDLTLWSHYGFSDYYERNDLSANAQGRWQYDDGEDIGGGTDAYLDWVSAKGDSVTVFAVAPQIDVTVGRAKFTGYATPGKAVRLELRDNATDDVKAIGIAVADDSGYVSGKFRNTAGHAMPVSVADRVVDLGLADDLNWYVPYIEATADVAGDTVSGTCYDYGNPGDTAIVMVRRTGHTRGFAIVGVDHAGDFAADFNGDGAPWFDPANIKHGDKIVVQCVLGTGDSVADTFLVP